jgi:RNA polymerase sigma factor (sigma-70 family)
VRSDHDARDLDLHRRLRDGDRAAFEELYTAYASPAYGLALRVTGHPGLAQEVVSDAFMALWRAPEAFDPARGAFRTFLLSLTHHRAVDTVRREERLRKRTQNPMNLQPDHSEDVAEEVVSKTWLAERRIQVRRALEGLPPEQQKVIDLAYFRGMTQVEISEELGIPLGTVKTRTLAAMRKLKAALKEDDA